MFRANEVRRYLGEHKSEFLDVERELRENLRTLRTSAAELLSLPGAQVLDRLGWPRERPGAFPTPEWDRAAGHWLPFEGGPAVGASNQKWISWAETVLRGATTLAVDGSQIFPSRDWSVPVAAVQVAWFENRHATGPDNYLKDVILRPVSPAELLAGGEDEVSLREKVSRIRYELEVETLASWMSANRGGRRLALFDGSLVVSFATAPQERRRYVGAVLDLMRASEEAETPLVAYIDSSRARDLAQMYSALAGLGETRITDGALLPQPAWGSRTPVFICARAQGLENYGDHTRKVCFLYLQSSRDGRPARVEFPLWILEAGRVDEVVNMLRAEIVAQAAGYPYAIETVDALAVLTNEDRLQFESIFQEFAEANGLQMQLRAKAASKRLRRR